MASVLLVDDDTLLLRVLGRELSAAGHDVSTAEDGVAAQELSAEKTFDVIVSDVKMPRMSGIELLEYITRATPYTQFIILAGEGSMEAALSAFKTGRVFDCLVKPLADIHALSVVVDRAAHHRNMIVEGARFAKERQELALLVENDADLVALTLLTGEISYINTAGRSLIGLDASQDCQSINLVDCAAEESRLDLEDARSALLQLGCWRGECFLQHRQSGEKILTNINAFTVRDTDNAQPFALAFVARDIRRFKLMERQLAQAQRLESIGQLAAGIAHEINTPIQYIGDNMRFLSDMFGELASILCLCSQLALAKDEPARMRLADELAAEVASVDLEYAATEVPASIAQTLEGIERVSRIVRAMKEFSHPDSEEQSTVDLNKSLECTVTVARNEWKYVADIVTEFDPNLPLLSCRAGELHQVFLNLIINASHAIADVVGEGSGDKGTITITTSFAEDIIEVRISDTGTGIPEGIRSKVFDHFFTTKSVGKGTGQGLAISHSVVQKHGGTIEFETDLGAGTTFIIRLPVAIDAEAASEDDIPLPRAA